MKNKSHSVHAYNTREQRVNEAPRQQEAPRQIKQGIKKSNKEAPRQKKYRNDDLTHKEVPKKNYNMAQRICDTQMNGNRTAANKTREKENALSTSMHKIFECRPKAFMISNRD